MNKECVFCKMFIFTNKLIIDIEPLNPVTPGHRIIIPRQHVEDFTEDIDVTRETMAYASRLAKKIGGDMNLITSKGTNATQIVNHLHVHLVPRTKDDRLYLPWTNQQINK